MKSLVLAGLALLAGCQTSALVDDVDLSLDFSPLTGPSDALHTPYVAGAQFNVWIEANHGDIHGWSIVSEDPTILSVGAFDAATNDGYAPAVAVRAGDTRLVIIDYNGLTRHTHDVSVKVPDRIDVLAHGPLLLGDETDAVVSSPQILTGGTATFLTEPYAEGDRLYGNHALSVVPHAGSTAIVEHTSFLEDRDWLAITADAEPGASSVDLVVAGQTIRTLPVEVVDDSVITSMQLVGESEKHRHSKESLVVVAEASSAGGPVYGVTYDFTVDGQAQAADGDVYRYTYDKHDDVMLEASHGTLADGVLIHSSGGYVSSTNATGCSAAPGSVTTPWALFCVGAAIVASRRRRYFEMSR
ncbi:MAG: hypothetical protein ABI321_22695 [Polyangia bacterium]